MPQRVHTKIFSGHDFTREPLLFSSPKHGRRDAGSQNLHSDFYFQSQTQQ